MCDVTPCARVSAVLTPPDAPASPASIRLDGGHVVADGLEGRRQLVQLRLELRVVGVLCRGQCRLGVVDGVEDLLTRRLGGGASGGDVVGGLGEQVMHVLLAGDGVVEEVDDGCEVLLRRRGDAGADLRLERVAQGGVSVDLLLDRGGERLDDLHLRAREAVDLGEQLVDGVGDRVVGVVRRADRVRERLRGRAEL